MTRSWFKKEKMRLFPGSIGFKNCIAMLECRTDDPKIEIEHHNLKAIKTYRKGVHKATKKAMRQYPIERDDE